jgi:putative protein kinase ArgK-like GTPase of G3E family
MISTNSERVANTMSGQGLNQLSQSSIIESQSLSNSAAIVVGIYGLPGSGKSFLLGQLKRELEL